MRPNETYHEPTRKFFRNEVFRIPIYEVLPLETIWQQCWVMDIPTFCKGRPIGSVEEHVYICEYRVDKKARLFDKIPKTSGKGKKSKTNDLSFCTKWFAFDTFDVRLKPSRNYAVSYGRPNSEIICGQNVGTKVVCGMIFFLEKKAVLKI